MSKNYEMLYAELEEAFRAGNYKKANEFANEIIKERPYFRDPYLYIYKLECLNKLTPESERTGLYQQLVKENLDNYICSYYINAQKEKIGEYGEIGIVNNDPAGYDDKDRWKLIKLLMDNFTHDLETKKYKEDGDVCSTYLGHLLDIYEYYGENEEVLNRYRADTAAYKGLQDYHSYLDYSQLPSENTNKIELNNNEKIESLIEDGLQNAAAEAKDNFEYALSLKPDHATANYGLGRYYYEVEGNIEKALELFHKAEQNFISMWEPYYFLGKIYAEKQDYEKAKDFYMLAISLYNDNEENGIDTLLEECAEDLSPIGGCKAALENATKGKYVVDDRDRMLPSKTQLSANAHLIHPPILKEFIHYFKSFQEDYFGDLWDAMSEENRQNIECAERAFYCCDKSQYDFFKPPMSKSWAFYYHVLFDEIVDKVFMSYKKTEWPKMTPEVRERNLNSLKIQGQKNEAVRILEKCLRGEHKKFEKPTLGQLLNILSCPSETNVIIGNIKDYTVRKTSLLADKTFCDLLDAIKSKRNAIEHDSIKEGETFLSHFAYFRENIIGTEDKKGLLPRFMESLR